MFQSLLVLCLLTGYQQQGVFEGDARFAKQISIRAEAESLETVLKNISDKVGAQLLASPALKGDLVILLAQSRTSGEVLNQIAKHFGWVWTREGDSFRLARPSGGDVKESQTAVKQAIQPLLDQQAKAKKEVANPKPINAKAIRDEMEALLKKISKLTPDDLESTERWKELLPLYSRLEELRSQLDPFSRFGKIALATMSDKHIRELETRGRIVLSYRPTPTQQSLSGDANRAAIQLVNYLVEQQQSQKTITPTDPEETELDPYFSPDYGTVIQPFVASDVATVRVCMEGSSQFGMRDSISPTVAVLSQSGQILAEGFPNFWNQSDSLIEDEVGEPPPYKSDPVNGKLNDALVRSATLKSALEELSGGELAMINYMAKMMDTSIKIDPLNPIAKAFTEIADSANVCLIADAYDSAISLSEGHNISGASVAELLTNLSESIDATFKFNGEWVSIRSNDWELKRASTIPRELFYKYRDLSGKQLGLTIDQLAEIAASVSDWQYNSEGLILTLGPASMNATFMGSSSATHYLLRAWNALSPIEKNIFASGASISWGNLNPRTKTMLGEYLYRDGDGENAYADLSDIDSMIAPQVAYVPTKPGQDNEITQLLPSGPLASAAVSIDFVRGDAVTVQFKAAGKSIPMTMPLTAFASMSTFMQDDQSLGIPIDMSKMKPGISEKLVVKMQLLPDLSRKGSISAAISVDGTEFGTFESLPEAMKKRIKEQEEKLKKLREGMNRGSPPPPPPPK